MSWIVGFIPLLLFGVGLWMYISKFLLRLVIVLFLLSGVTGFAVLFTYVFHRGEGDSTLLATGGGIVAILALIACLEVFVKGLHRRHGTPKRWHPWLALALGALIGVSATPAVIATVGAVSDGVHSVPGYMQNTGGG